MNLDELLALADAAASPEVTALAAEVVEAHRRHQLYVEQAERTLALPGLLSHHADRVRKGIGYDRTRVYWAEVALADALGIEGY